MSVTFDEVMLRTMWQRTERIRQLEAENERLRAALEEVRVLVFGANNSDLRYPKALAALKEPRT